MASHALNSNETPPQAAGDALRSRPSPWMTYARTAAYTGWSVRYLRNLVSAGQIPVYGKPRSRRFRRDVIDLYLTDRDAAMRKFRLERSKTHGR